MHNVHLSPCVHRLWYCFVCVSVTLSVSLSTARPHVDPLLTNVGNGSGPHSIPHTNDLGIECSFGGVPTPFQRWYQDGTVISSEEGVASGSGGEAGSETRALQLEPVSGVYQCHVSSQHGTAITTTVLCVQSKFLA